MPLAVTTQDPVSHENYSFDPGRDIAYFWPTILGDLIKKLAWDFLEPEYRELCIQHDIGPIDLMETLRAYSVTLDLAQHPGNKTIVDDLVTSGFGACHWVARLIVLAKVGQVGTGAFWAGIRHAVTTGVVPAVLDMMVQNATAMLAEASNGYRQGNNGETQPST